MEPIIDFLTRNWFFLLIIAILLLALVRRPRKATRLNTIEEFEDLINSGAPVITEFFDET